MEQDLLTPTRYHRPRRCNSENEESEGSSSAVLSSDTSNFEDVSDDDVRRTPTLKRRKNSADNSLHLPLPRIRTRAFSLGQNTDHAELSEDPKQPEEDSREGMLVEELGGLCIFEE